MFVNVGSVRGTLCGARGEPCLCVDVEKLSRLPRGRGEGRGRISIFGCRVGFLATPTGWEGDACLCMYLENPSSLHSRRGTWKLFGAPFAG